MGLTHAVAGMSAASAAGPSSGTLGAARAETAVSLAFHICFAVIGVGLPWLLAYVEHRAIRTGDAIWMALARKWSRAFAVLFAIGAVSGTVLSFEFGLLWPGFLGTYGGVLGLPFTLEAFAFLAEAVFLGLYLYGWNRLRPRAHWWTGVLVAIAGTFSTLFIVTANAWMNVPTGVTERAGKVIAAKPWAALTSAAAAPECTHMLLAALMCTGAAVASVYAVGMLRGRRDLYHRRGLSVGLVTLLACAPLQILVGDWSVRSVEAHQPAKFAALEGIARTRTHAPITIGGIFDAKTGHIVGGLPIPDALSLLAHFSPSASVPGLDVVARGDSTPMVTAVHLSFDTMVGIGTALFGFGALLAWRAWRRRRAGLPALATDRWTLRGAALVGPATYVAMLAGWMVTELGRQPWIVYFRTRDAQAATTSGDVGVWLAITILIYLTLATALVLILRRMATGGPAAGGDGDSEPDAPQGPATRRDPVLAGAGGPRPAIGGDNAGGETR
jgi:cytochrome d ubiquinol oxidase subunit I